MVEASKDLACVLVNCDWGKKNVDLSTQYGVRGYPTVIFCDPDGKPLEELGARDAASVAAQMRRVVARVNAGEAAPPGPADPAPPPFGAFSPLALGAAKTAGKPLLVYFFDDSPASLSTHQSLMDPALRPIAPRFLAAKAPYAKDDPVCVRFKVDRAPTILVLDPTLERPEESPLARIAGSRSARELLRDLDPLRLGKSAPGPEPPAGAPAGPRPFLTKEDEALSDDELDRQFIRAQLRVAEEHLNRNRRDKAKEVLNDIVKNFPKHRATLEAKKLLEKLN